MDSNKEEIESIGSKIWGVIKFIALIIAFMIFMGSLANSCGHDIDDDSYIMDAKE